MVGGAFKFILAVIVFFIAGLAINPMLASIFNGFQLEPIGLFVAQIFCAGLVISSGKKR